MVDLEKLPQDRRKQYVDWPRERRRRHTKCFIISENVELAFLGCNKCGTTTATRVLRSHGSKVEGPQTYEEHYSRYPVVSMWRDPYQRIESTYRWAQTALPWNASHEFFPYGKVNEVPFAQWVEKVCTEPVDGWYDLHLASQTWLNTHPLGRWPDLLLPWNWDELYRLFKIPIRGRLIANQSNKAIPTTWTHAARDAFERTYTEDLNNWEKINGI